MSYDLVEFFSPANESTFEANETICGNFEKVRMGFGWASICCFILFVVLTILLKKWKTTADKLVIVLNFCSLGGSVAYVLESPQSAELRCTVDAWLIQTSDWAQLVCCLCIIFHRYASIENYKQREGRVITVRKVDYQRIDAVKIECFKGCKPKVKYSFARYFILILVFAFIFSTAPFFDQRYGAKGAWCWIKKTETDAKSTYILWVLFIWYFWMGLVMVGLIIYGCCRLCNLKDIPENDNEDKKNKKRQQEITRSLIA